MRIAPRFTAVLGVLLAVLCVQSFGQSNSVDPAFAPVASIKFANDDVPGKGIVAQPDGKVIIFGGNLAVDGVAKGFVARLNIDGTVDNTFSYCGCLLDYVSNVRVQTDGKILMSGNANSRAKVVRLNSDGTLDPSFATSLEFGGVMFSTASLNTIQADGKILIQYTSQLDFGYHTGSVIRLNIDGSTDTGFTAIGYDGGRIVFGNLTALAVESSGKIYVAIKTSSGGSGSSVLRRYNADGTQDSGWIPPNFSPSIGTEYNGIAVQADGSLLISGRFDTVNGLSKRDLVRVLPAGNVDMNFTAPLLGSGAGQLLLLGDGKILVGYNVTGNGLMTRLNSDGSADATFVLSPSVSIVSSRFSLDPSGRILFFGLSNQLVYRFFRLNVNGDADATFNPNVSKYAAVRSLALQPDGKIIIAGKFDQLNGVPRAKIGRVNADGTLDASFDPGTGFDYAPFRLAVQADGKIIAAGDFTTYNGSSRPGLVRLNSNGSTDGSFTPSITGSVLTASVQSDGMILIGGTFTAVDSIAKTGAARLTAAGVLEPTFNPIIGSPSITDIYQQADTKIMVGGSFNGVNGFNRSAIVRLNNDGSLDQTFDATGPVSVQRIWPQPDGKYITTGFSTMRRRNGNGSIDGSFSAPTITNGSNAATFDAVIIQPDGTLIVGGNFTSVNNIARRHLIRLTSTGVLDLLFFSKGADGPVRASLRQPDEKIVIGGEFAKVQDTSRAGIARLSVAQYRVVAPFDFDGDGRADISVVRPSSNRWYELLSGTGSVHEETFGIAGDLLAPADFDGDGITDEAIYRPSNGQWWFRSSLNGDLVLNQFGGSGDIPRPSDFDGDGKADLVLFNPATNTWSWFSSLSHQASSATFGLSGDQPLVGDFDGDGKGDLAIFRPSSGDWWYAASSANGAFRTAHWGQNGDVPVPADYDGDGRTDYAIFRPSDGGWYIYNSGNGSITTTAFGVSTDRPVAADYDGDGRADIAVFRPSTGIWYLLRSTSGFAGYQFGINTDIAIPGSLIP
jgi:uncharacterized delta-60 repeat protein